MAKNDKKTRDELFKELVAAKTKAGLSREQAEEVSNRQLDEDEAAEKAAEKPAEASKEKK